MARSIAGSSTHHTSTSSLFGGRAPLKLSLVGRWIRIAEERRRLADADPALLEDIGVSRAQATRESARPFWDLPSRR